MLKSTQNKWVTYTTTQRVLTIICSVFCFVVSISCIIGIFNIIDVKYTNFITIPLLGVVFLLSGIRDYHSDPKGSKQSFFVAGIMLFTTIFNIILCVIR